MNVMFKSIILNSNLSAKIKMGLNSFKLFKHFDMECNFANDGRTHCLLKS